MGKIDKLKSMSTEELTEKRSKLKTTVTILGAFMGIAFIFIIYVAVKTKNYAFFSIVCGVSLTLLPAISQLKEIDKELKERNQSQSVK
jgi:hypothetical protein